jgi:hypothetical protein
MPHSSTHNNLCKQKFSSFHEKLFLQSVIRKMLWKNICLKLTITFAHLIARYSVVSDLVWSVALVKFSARTTPTLGALIFPALALGAFGTQTYYENQNNFKNYEVQSSNAPAHRLLVSTKTLLINKPTDLVQYLNRLRATSLSAVEAIEASGIDSISH